MTLPNMWRLIGAGCAAVLPAVPITLSAQARVTPSADAGVLTEYAGVYQWGEDHFVYLQLWSEFTGTNQLVAFDESGEVRTLYRTSHDRFFAGPGAAVQGDIQSRITFR